jgi:hypothetical protein
MGVTGSGEAQERGIVGETPNLAARLQGIAEPNTVVIADSTRRLIGNLLELKDLGSKDLKGIMGPVRAWAAGRLISPDSTRSPPGGWVRTTREMAMAKGQMKGNKEAKKPKGDKPKSGGSAYKQSQGAPSGPAPSPFGKKK